MSTRLEIGRDRASGGFPLSLGHFFVRTIVLTVLLPVSFALLLPVAAMEAPPLRFSQLAPADGLPQGHINAILQNDCGVMWFATQDGLALYDGYKIWTFHPDVADPNSLSNGFVRDLAAGPDDRIWIATDGGGLDVFDRETRIFTHYTHDENDPNSLSNDVVRTLHFDRSGTLWVGTNGGLNRFDPKNNNFTHYRHDPAREDSLSNDPIRTIHDDDRGGLWIGTFGGGLNRLDIATGKFRHYRSSSSPYALRDDKIRSVYQDRWGSLWVGTYSEGLHRYVPEIDGFVVYNTKQGPAGPSGLTSNYREPVGRHRPGIESLGPDNGQIHPVSS
jgi:ligand-binding sensor domain-containing protein